MKKALSSIKHSFSSKSKKGKESSSSKNSSSDSVSEKIIVTSSRRATVEEKGIDTKNSLSDNSKFKTIPFIFLTFINYMLYFNIILIFIKNNI